MIKKLNSLIFGLKVLGLNNASDNILSLAADVLSDTYYDYDGMIADDSDALKNELSSFDRPASGVFLSIYSFSNGWISPDGKYFYKTKKDHSQMAWKIVKAFYPEEWSGFTRHLQTKDIVEMSSVMIMCSSILSRNNWMRVTNAFNISAMLPKRIMIDTFLDLVFSYPALRPDNDEDREISLRSDNSLLFRGDIFELEKFSKHLS